MNKNLQGSENIPLHKPEGQPWRGTWGSMGSG